MADIPTLTVQMPWLIMSTCHAHSCQGISQFRLAEQRDDLITGFMIKFTRLLHSDTGVQLWLAVVYSCVQKNSSGI